WKDKPLEEATWEEADTMAQQFPSLNLGDKVVSQGVDIDRNTNEVKTWRVYKRRNKTSLTNEVWFVSVLFHVSNIRRNCPRPTTATRMHFITTHRHYQSPLHALSQILGPSCMEQHSEAGKDTLYSLRLIRGSIWITVNPVISMSDMATKEMTVSTLIPYKICVSFKTLYKKLDTDIQYYRATRIGLPIGKGLG
ncbi:hypothetical protein A2U01_0009603, partial [Trifolium medium]|nr:hypothetical protein [Trifolium medium]